MKPIRLEDLKIGQIFLHIANEDNDSWKGTIVIKQKINLTELKILGCLVSEYAIRTQSQASVKYESERDGEVTHLSVMNLSKWRLFIPTKKELKELKERIMLSRL
ncbi:MAG TPA: hypothetical protein VIR31_05910 [Nitrososphaeraceae archaeon]